MPFLAPFAAPLVSAGASIGSSILGSKLTKAKPSAMEQQVLNQNMEAQKLGMDTGKNLIGMGTNTIQPVLNYWSSILSGNRGQMTSAMAPEISRIGQGYQTAANTSAALQPRGGPGASFMSELPFQQQRDVSTLLQQARPQAAGALGGLGGGILGQGANALYASTAAGQNILQQQEAMRKLEAERGKSVGGGLFDIFTKYGMPALQAQFPGIFGDTTNKVKNLPGSTSTGDVGTSGRA